MQQTVIGVSPQTRDLVAGLRRGDKTYNSVIRMLVSDHGPVTLSLRREVVK